MASTKIASALVSKIEIERKFIPKPSLLQALAATRPRVQFIRDVYYDRHDARLTTEGLWVRKRTVLDANNKHSDWRSSWEVKVRVGGDRVASQFVEIDGEEAVERELHRVLGNRKVTVGNIAGYLEVMCDLTSRRLAGPLPENLCNESDRGMQSRLTVTTDQVVETPNGDLAEACPRLEAHASGALSPGDAFFHEIGELEMMEEVRTDPSQSRTHEEHRKQVAAEGARQLDAFMLAHPEFFPMTPRPSGKLNAYFAWLEGRKR